MILWTVETFFKYNSNVLTIVHKFTLTNQVSQEVSKLQKDHQLNCF